MPNLSEFSRPKFGWTAHAVRRLPKGGPRYECVDGELLVTPAPTQGHQLLLASLFRRIDPFVEANRVGKLLWSPADIELDRATLVQPDLFVMPLGISTTAPWRQVQHLLLVIEVLSPSTAHADREIKRSRYQRAGIGEAWIVDPAARVIEVWRPEHSAAQRLDATLIWSPNSADASLELDLPSLFAEALGPAG